MKAFVVVTSMSARCVPAPAPVTNDTMGSAFPLPPIVVVPVIVTASPVAVERSVVDALAMFVEATVIASFAATAVVAPARS